MQMPSGRWLPAPSLMHLAVRSAQPSRLRHPTNCYILSMLYGCGPPPRVLICQVALLVLALCAPYIWALCECAVSAVTRRSRLAVDAAAALWWRVKVHRWVRSSIDSQLAVAARTPCTIVVVVVGAFSWFSHVRGSHKSDMSAHLCAWSNRVRHGACCYSRCAEWQWQACALGLRLLAQSCDQQWRAFRWRQGAQEDSSTVHALF